MKQVQRCCCLNNVFIIDGNLRKIDVTLFIFVDKPNNLTSAVNASYVIPSPLRVFVSFAINAIYMNTNNRLSCNLRRPIGGLVESHHRMAFPNTIPCSMGCESHILNQNAYICYVDVNTLYIHLYLYI